MSVKKYIDSYNLLDFDKVNCKYVEYMIYTAFINKFIYELEEDEYYLFELYYSKIRNFVEDLRDKPQTFIDEALEYIKENTQFMVDIILMQWSLPNINLISSSSRCIDYKNKINQFNTKLNTINKNIISDACERMLCNNKSFPIHCIDLLWNSLCIFELDLIFINRQSADYITISNNEEDNATTIIISLNIEYLLYLGLGLVENNYGKNFKSFIESIIENKELYNYFLKSKSGRNFEIQCKNIKNIL